MASVFMSYADWSYDVEYSILDGRIRDFQSDETGKWAPVPDERKRRSLEMVATDVFLQQHEQGHGYSAFILKMIGDGDLFAIVE